MEGGQRGILFFPFLPLLLTFPRSSFCSCTFDLLPFLRSSTLIHSLRRRAKKRMYFSSIHCAVVMTTTILDNLPPLEDMSSVISGHFISHFDEKIVINKKCIQGGNKYIYTILEIIDIEIITEKFGFYVNIEDCNCKKKKDCTYGAKLKRKRRYDTIN